MNLLRLCGLALACLLSSCSIAPAIAQEITTGTGLVCDTAAQVERFIAVMEDDYDVAVEQVNAEVKLASGKQYACGVVSIAYARGDKVKTVRDRRGDSADIVGIGVVAQLTPFGWRPFSEPQPQFTIFETPGSDI